MVAGALVSRALLFSAGHALIVSPFSWMTEYTPREKWLCGADGDSAKALEAVMAQPQMSFVVVWRRTEPLLIRDHARKFQLIFSHAILFRRENTPPAASP